MIVNKIVGFAFANTNNLSYIKNQLNAIKNSCPDLEIELADETDSRLARLKPEISELLPLYIIYKNGVYKTHHSGKFDNTQIINWLNSVHGLT